MLDRRDAAEAVAETLQQREPVVAHRGVVDVDHHLVEERVDLRTQPGQAALDPKTFEGETITKDVTVNAEMRTPEGQTVNKTLTITIARVAGGGREGRPIITKITGL